MAQCMRSPTARVDFFRSQGGQTLNEFAITLSVLLTAVFTIIELCLLFYTWSTISECAREGTRYAVVRGSTCVTAGSTGAGQSCTASATDINNFVYGLRYPNIGGGAMGVNTTFSSDGTTFGATGNNAPNDIVRIQITYDFPVRLPFVPKNSVRLSTQSQMRILQ